MRMANDSKRENRVVSAPGSGRVDLGKRYGCIIVILLSPTVSPID